ncbi:MAG: phospholipase D family protein [Planctomycetes bacterium]|nr:phospholipase D family protein [Planctomycetota bacterium]
MTWPLDPMTLMWIQVATGATGMLTLVYLFRIVAQKFSDTPEVLVFFSPKGGCQDAIVRELKAAKSEILVQAYSFTADPLTFGLVDATKNGINVEIVLDKSNELERYSDLHIFLENGVDVKIDHDHAIAHSKIIIIDQTTLITGSFNFTNQAEHENAENLLIIKGHPELIQHYRENFFKHREHAKPAVIKEGVKDRRQQQGHKAA